MTEKNKANDSVELISEESEDYTIEDVIELNKIEEDANDSDFDSSVKSRIKNFKIKPPSDEIKYENNDYNLKEFADVEAILKRSGNIFASKISVNLNRFSKMTYNESLLKELYKGLENISKRRGNPKEIIEIGSKIEDVESEKQKQYITDEEIEKTIEEIKNLVDLLLTFEGILENRYL